MVLNIEFKGTYALWYKQHKKYPVYIVTQGACAVIRLNMGLKIMMALEYFIFV